MADKHFYRTVVEIEILSEEPYEPQSLTDILCQITEGHSSGKWEVKSNLEVTPAQMAQFLWRKALPLHSWGWMRRVSHVVRIATNLWQDASVRELMANTLAQECGRLEALNRELLDTLKAVLEHVEDTDAKRINGQCTLCSTYRGMIRHIIAKAEKGG